MSTCSECGANVDGYRPYMSDDLMVPPCPKCIGTLKKENAQLHEELLAEQHTTYNVEAERDDARSIIEQLYEMFSKSEKEKDAVVQRTYERIIRGVESSWAGWLRKVCPWLEEDAVGEGVGSSFTASSIPDVLRTARQRGGEYGGSLRRCYERIYPFSRQT